MIRFLSPSRIRQALVLAVVAMVATVAVPQTASAEQASATAAVAFARRDINLFWSGVLKSWNVPYRAPTVIWYNTAGRPGPVVTPCGAISVNNAGYCPRNQVIYMDARFSQRHFQSEGDFAVFTIVAHEWGHHIQNLVGIQRAYERGQMTTKQIELQADCFAGVYAKSAERRKVLEPGDLEEALTITEQAGDIPGTAPDDPRAHGTPEERYQSFLSGYQDGDPKDC